MRESIENLWDRAGGVSHLLDAYRTEILSEAAEKIRKDRAELEDFEIRWLWGGMQYAADLIDPEV